MSAFLPLLRVSVKNAYFENGTWRGIDFTALGLTDELLGRHRVLVRPLPGGLALYVRQDLLEGLRDRARHEGPLALVWRLDATDATAHHFTEIPGREGQVLLFEKTDHGRRLHPAAQVDGTSLIPMSDARLAAWITRREVLARPVGLVLLNLTSPMLDDVGEGSDFPHDTEICFGARATYWQYYVHEPHAQGDALITDTANEHQFRFMGHQQLEGRQAAVYRSQQPIALREYPHTQLQLRAKSESQAVSGRVLIAQLPQPSARQLLRHPESTQRGQPLLSEVFVYP